MKADSVAELVELAARHRLSHPEQHRSAAIRFSRTTHSQEWMSSEGWTSPHGDEASRFDKPPFRGSESAPSTRSRRIHSRTYGGHPASSMPSSSQRIRKRTAGTSTGVTWRRSRILRANGKRIVSSCGAGDAVPAGRFRARQVGHQRLTCGLIRLPLPRIRKRGDRHELTLIEASERRIHHILGSHHDFPGQLFDGFAGQFPQVSSGRSR